MQTDDQSADVTGLIIHLSAFKGRRCFHAIEHVFWAFIPVKTSADLHI